jgi:hypothetical protein
MWPETLPPNPHPPTHPPTDTHTLTHTHQVPPENQGRVLSWGIFGAMGMRALMVLAGVSGASGEMVVLLAVAGRSRRSNNDTLQPPTP